MRAALVVHRPAPAFGASLAAMEQAVGEAADAGAHLVLFPEAAPTGLVNNDDPAHDLPLGQPIPGAVTDRLSALARRRGIWLATGLLEREGPCLYDSAVLLDPHGAIAFRYRRIQPQWHGRDADARVYRQGERVEAAATPMGRVTCLLCGDLFDDAIVEQTRALEPDLLLFPFARNFGDGSFDDARWLRDEQPAYAARAACVGCTTLMVNSLDDPTASDYPTFGGALVVSPAGDVLARKPLGEPGTLYAEL
jgi:N-carbamoylputrescine amidase